MRYIYVVPMLLAGVLWAQSAVPEAKPLDRQKAARERMEAAIARQKESVKRQLGAAPGAADSFFTVPWQHPAALVAGGVEAQCPPLGAEEIEKLVGEAAKREELQPELLRSVMEQESGFRPCAVSAKGAQGLMQLMPDTAAQFGVKDPFDPKENVATGAKFLKDLLKRYNGNVEAALGAYNAGPGRVDAAGGVPPLAETIQYVQRILGALGH